MFCPSRRSPKLVGSNAISLGFACTTLINGVERNCCQETGACATNGCEAFGLNEGNVDGNAVCKWQNEDCVKNGTGNCFGRVVCAKGSKSCAGWGQLCIQDGSSPGGFKACKGSRVNCSRIRCINGKQLCSNGQQLCSEGYIVEPCPADLCKGISCANGGSCQDGKCLCPEGFHGSLCQHDPCSNVTCSNGGSCKDGKCVCPQGFAGPRCEVDFCKHMQDEGLCLNSGTCSGGKCQCVNGFSGKTCQISSDPCANIICKNGGTCNKAEKKCECLKGFGGLYCGSRVELLSNTVSYKGVVYATLNDGLVNESTPGCQSDFLPIPAGWELAENTSDAREVVGKYAWSTNRVVLKDGSAIQTLIRGSGAGTIEEFPYPFLQSEGLKFKPHQCFSRILIRRLPLEA